MTNSTIQPAASTTPTMTTLYTVAWTGGMEDPSFLSFTSEEQAVSQYDSWLAESGDSADRVTLIVTTVAADGTVTTVKVNEHCPAWGDADRDDTEDDAGAIFTG